MLVLLRDNKLQIEAEAATGANSVEVVLRPEPSASLNFPETLFQTVMRTRQRVIIDDARRPNPFAEDAYVVRHRPRSVLCLPLLKQAKLIGLIYLENNLAPRPLRRSAPPCWRCWRHRPRSRWKTLDFTPS